MPTNSPLITTIIPTYRRPDLLKRAIRSVLNQTFPDFQICVYDNASGDETAQVVADIAKEEPRVKYYCHPENIGALNNFNYGLQHVETPFFSFLSDDDMLLPEFYQKAIESFTDFSDSIFFAGQAIKMTPDGNVCTGLNPAFEQSEYFSPPQGMFEMLKSSENHMIWTSVVFRTEIIQKIGIIDIDIGPPSDSDFILRTAAKYPFVFAKVPCAIFMPQSSFSQLSIYIGWSNILRKIKNDDELPIETRLHIEKMLTLQFKKKLLFYGMRSIYIKNFSDAYEISGILHLDYRKKANALALMTTAKLCEKIIIFHKVYMIAYNLVARLLALKNAKFTNAYKNFVRIELP